MTERGSLSNEEILDMPLGSLITTISRAHSAFLIREIEVLGITMGQFQFLMGLAREDGITQEELANNFHMNESTIARALRKLEDSGTVKRKVDDNNRRKKIITVTEKGITIVDSIKKKDEEWEEMIRSLSDGQKHELKKLLRTLAVESGQLMKELKDQTSVQ